MSTESARKQFVYKVRWALLPPIYQFAFWRAHLPVIRRVNRLFELIQRKCWAHMLEADRDAALSTVLACCRCQKGVDHSHYSELEEPDYRYSGKLRETAGGVEQTFSTLEVEHALAALFGITIETPLRKASHKSKSRKVAHKSRKV